MLLALLTAAATESWHVGARDQALRELARRLHLEVAAVPTEPLLLWGAATYLSRALFRTLRMDTDQVQDVVEGVKAGQRGAITRAARWMASIGDLHRPALVVPVPRSTAERPSLFPLARALVSYGVGDEARIVLTRATPVPSSRAQRQAGGSGVDPAAHLASLAADLPRKGEAERAVLLVDDVSTDGNILVAATQALRRAGWRGSIRAAVVAIVEDNPEVLFHRSALRARLRQIQVPLKPALSL
jgi:predicted amidophosphoribosyltransferase